ncbi:MAG: hypothetical protein RL095_3535 [Verrucomicrobiota bacterium]|jgi:hypothetical protein
MILRIPALLLLSINALQARAAEEKEYHDKIKPLMEKYCTSCHGAEKMKSGIRVDLLTPAFEDRHLQLWREIRKELEEEEMPPEEKPQPSAEERQALLAFIDGGIKKALERDKFRNGQIRRLTRLEYRNTLQDLLGLDENLARVLPEEGLSKEGFANNTQILSMSPLQLESYMEIACQALDMIIVDPKTPPVVQNFRIDLGHGVNPKASKENLILGAGSELLANDDHRITELTAVKNFPIKPFAMRKSYDFIEGYRGNDTVRGWRHFDGLQHAVYACLRGGGGYPKGEPYSIIDEGLLLRPSIPVNEMFGQGSTMGTTPNFKISLRELPAGGKFRVKVKAARYDDMLPLDAGSKPINAPAGIEISQSSRVKVPKSGIYQLDLRYASSDKVDKLNIKLGTREFGVRLNGAFVSQLELSLDDLAKFEFDTARITVPGKNKVINLHEVEIYQGGKNIAPRSTVLGSSLYDMQDQFAPQNLVDGNKSNLAHTGFENNPWLELKFPESVRADSLTVFNRGGFEQRFEGAKITFSQKGKKVAERQFSGAPKEKHEGFFLVHLEAGDLPVALTVEPSTKILSAKLSPVAAGSPAAERFAAYQRTNPRLGVHLGFRRDDGHSLVPVRMPDEVKSSTPQIYTFEGSINDFPAPSMVEENDNYLAGLREIGVRSEYTDGRDVPRLLVQSVEFEGPVYDSWPPKSHSDIFIASPHQDQPETYAREILAAFMPRAWRRSVSPGEIEAMLKIWKDAYAAKPDFRAAVKDALLCVLTSPQFLYLIEDSPSPAKEDLSGTELAAKISYALWNRPPESALIAAAESGALRRELPSRLQKMLLDSRAEQGLETFVRQWLQLDKFDTVAVDERKFKDLHKNARAQLRREPVEFVKHLLRQNLPVSHLVESDFIMANDLTAAYYKLPSPNSGFDFVPVSTATRRELGGLLSQVALLTGLSDGHESHPVKRGAWLARKIVAEPPGDPPPNVPGIDKSGSKEMTLRQRLELHRSQPGCVKCHEKIDPWGIPFETFDAAGRYKPKAAADAKLPDGTEVKDLDGLKAYLAKQRPDQIAYSFMKHFASYAAGRSLSYGEEVWLRAEATRLIKEGAKMQDLALFVLQSDVVIKK